MGVGLGFALAAAIYCRDYHPNKRVVCVEGDSAFGFSGMEIETIARYSVWTHILGLEFVLEYWYLLSTACSSVAQVHDV